MLSASALAPVSSQAEDIAAAPAADKSNYSLFDPTPVDQERSFCTDRPTKSNFPCTVDAGHVLYEADAFNWSYNHNGALTQDTYLFTNPTFKLGLTNRIDIEANITPLEEILTHDKASGSKTDLTGNGDLYLRVKYNLVGNDSGDIAVTLLPYVKLPTAEPGIGNKSVEEGIITPLSFVLPKNFLLILDPEIDELRNISDQGYHTSYQGLMNLSHSLLVDSVTMYGELWSQDNRDPSGVIAESSLDLAITWLAQPNLQLDVGTNIGLNHATPDFQSYVGISQRF